MGPKICLGGGEVGMMVGWVSIRLGGRRDGEQRGGRMEEEGWEGGLHVLEGG